MENLIGERFVKLVVEEFSHKVKGHRFWGCLCDCGKRVIVEQSKLKTGHTKSCGCIKKSDLTELISQSFGLLRVLEEAEPRIVGNKRRRFVKCVCDCGNVVEVRLDQLRDGNTKSCGCFAKDRSLIALPEYTDSVALKKAKSIHKGIRQRCYNSNNIKYSIYGGRGIIVCERWLDKKTGFISFLEDMGTPPSHKHQLDRIDNDGNYEPRNCRWVTNTQNSMNKKTDFNITYRGVTKPIGEWVEELELDYGSIKDRILFGWDAERAFNTPVGQL